MIDYPKTVLLVCTLISPLLITTSAHYYNLNTGQWQYSSGRQGYGNRPYSYYPQQPRQQQNSYPNIQVAKADWVCKNAAGDMVILTEDDSPPKPNPNNNVNVGRVPLEPAPNNNDNNNNNNQNQAYPPLNYNPQNPKNPFLPDFSKLPPVKQQPPIEPPQTENPNGEGLIDIRFGA